MSNEQASINETAIKLAEIIGTTPPKIMQEAVNVALRPKIWSGRSTAPYYDKAHAIMAKKILDKLVITPDNESKGLILTATVFGCTAGTVYNKWNQGALYLIENMDTPHGEYRALHERLEVSRRSDGILLSFRKSFNLDAIQVVDVSKSNAGVIVDNTWRIDMEQWLDNPEADSIFKREGLHLSPEEQEELENSFSGIESIVYKISGSKIILRRV